MIVPRVCPAPEATELFRKVYALDIKTELSWDREAMFAVACGYRVLYEEEGNLDAGANLLRLLFIAAAKGRTGESEDELVFKRARELLRVLADNGHPAAPVYELLARIYCAGDVEGGMERMRELSAEGNPLALRFFELLR